MNEKAAICLNCKNYYITWDEKFPKGCMAFGFKSTKIPCNVVIESSVEMCKMYKPKEKEV